MARPARRRTWSLDHPNLSECLGVQKLEQAQPAPSVLNESFRRVKTFAGEQQNSSLHALVHEAEYASATFQVLSHSREKCNKSPSIVRLPSTSPSRSRSLSQGPDTPGSLVNPRGRRPHLSTCLEPPKLKFGDPIVPPPADIELQGHSPLSNSLLIEYLARVTTNQPYGGLRANLEETEELTDDEISEPIGQPLRKLAMTSPTPPPPAIASTDNSSNNSLRRPKKKVSRYRLYSGDNLPSHETSLLKPADDYRLKKISTEMEAEQVRSLLHSLDRKCLLRAPGGRESLSGSSTPRHRKESRTLFTVDGLAASFSTPGSRDPPRMALTPIPKIEIPAPPSPVPLPIPTKKSTETGAMRKISRREHNIMAPVSF